MNAIPWYQSPVMVSAIVAIISQVLVLIGKQDVIPIEVITTKVEAFFQIVALGATLWAAWKRKSSTLQPVTLTKSGAETKSAQGGRASVPLLSTIVIGGIAVAIMAVAGCAGTRSAYKAADTPDEYAFVITEHYAALVKEAADLKAKPTTPTNVIEAMQAADLKVAPVIDALRPLRDAYLATKSAQSQAELQEAVNRAVLALADFVRTMKSARASSVGYRGADFPLIEVPA